MKFYLSLFLLFVYFISYAQDPTKQKQLSALRTVETPKIDGFLDDACWVNVPIATDFFEIRPVPGRVEKKERRTEMKVLYDDVAIYVYARMYDDKDSVSHELVSRDNIGNADFISIIVDPFYDKMNGNGFFVTAAGVQFDAKYSQVGDEDPNWNAVWESAVKIDEKGWTCEMKIPYSALRFSGKGIQNWGLNFSRRIQRTNVQTFWNYVNPAVNGFINQEGLFTGIKDIKPPLRLSFSPYISAYVNHYPVNLPGVKNTTSRFNGAWM